MDDLNPFDDQLVWVVARGVMTENGVFGTDLAQFTLVLPGPVDVPALMAESDLVTPYPAGWWIVVKGEGDLTIHLMTPGDVAERAEAAAQAMAAEMAFSPDFAVRFAPPFAPQRSEPSPGVASLRWALV